MQKLGLTTFGVNLTRLALGVVSSLRHAYSRQDEFVYILQGNPILHTNEGRTPLSPGMCAGLKVGTGNAHSLINETSKEVCTSKWATERPETKETIPTMISRRLRGCGVSFIRTGRRTRPATPEQTTACGSSMKRTTSNQLRWLGLPLLSNARRASR